MPDTAPLRSIIVAPSVRWEPTWIHVDVMDGRFVPNITIGPMVFEAALRSTQKPLNVDLMIIEPDRYLAAFAKAGADHLLVKAEPPATVHRHRVLSQIHDLGKRDYAAAIVAIRESNQPSARKACL
jgi:pentose-5-phosphate-3-epimerase